MHQKMIISIGIILLLLLMACGSKQQIREAQSVVDSPAIHYDRGKALMAQGKVDAALAEFEQAKSLAPKYAPAYEGMAQAYLEKGDVAQAKALSDKALKIDGKWVLAKAVRARVKSKEGKHEDAIKAAKNAIKDVPKSTVPDKKYASVAANLALGDIYRDAGMFTDAQTAYMQVLDIDRLNMKADQAIKDLAKYQSAVAGQRPELKKIAGQKEITRSDAAVLFAMELPLNKVFRETPQASQAGYRPPGESTMGKRETPGAGESLPPDVPANHWAKSFITEVVEKGVMETMPDGNFNPDDPVNRADFARLLEKFMVRYWNDPTLETKFFGTTSPFADVNNTSPIFNAVMVVSSRSLIPGYDDGTFRPLDGVSGADALNIIRKLKANL